MYIFTIALELLSNLIYDVNTIFKLINDLPCLLGFHSESGGRAVTVPGKYKQEEPRRTVTVFSYEDKQRHVDKTNAAVILFARTQETN